MSIAFRAIFSLYIQGIFIFCPFFFLKFYKHEATFTSETLKDALAALEEAAAESLNALRSGHFWVFCIGYWFS
jgi:hypothetical protein